MIELTGLYAKTSRSGRHYLSGRLGNSRVILLKNDAKRSGRHPDYRLFVAELQSGMADELKDNERRELQRLLDRDDIERPDRTTTSNRNTR